MHSAIASAQPYWYGESEEYESVCPDGTIQLHHGWDLVKTSLRQPFSHPPYSADSVTQSHARIASDACALSTPTTRHGIKVVWLCPEEGHCNSIWSTEIPIVQGNCLPTELFMDTITHFDGKQRQSLGSTKYWSPASAQRMVQE